jgi:hypothetical protein
MLYRCPIPGLMLLLLLVAGCTPRDQSPSDNLADLAGAEIATPEAAARIDAVTGIDQQPLLVRHHSGTTVVIGRGDSGLVLTGVDADGDVAWQQVIERADRPLTVDWVEQHSGGFSAPLVEVHLDDEPARTLLLAVTDAGPWPVRLVDARRRSVNYELSDRLPTLQYPATSLTAPDMVSRQAALVRLAQPQAAVERRSAKVTSQLQELAGSTSRWQAEDAASILHQD